MRIIKHGKIEKRIFLCVLCRCEFEADFGEYASFNGGSCCRCPECAGIAFEKEKEADDTP